MNRKQNLFCLNITCNATNTTYTPLTYSQYIAATIDECGVNLWTTISYNRVRVIGIQ